MISNDGDAPTTPPNRADKRLLQSLAQGERRQNWLLLALVFLVGALVVINVMALTASEATPRDEAQPLQRQGVAGGAPSEEILWPTSRFSTHD